MATSNSSSLRNLEQLVAGVRVEDLHQRLLGMAGGREAGVRNDRVDLAPHHRDLAKDAAVRRRGVEAEETPLADDVPVRREALDPDIVEVGAPVHGRPAVGLREDERMRLLREHERARRQRRAFRALRTRRFAENPEARSRDLAHATVTVVR